MVKNSQWIKYVEYVSPNKAVATSSKRGHKLFVAAVEWNVFSENSTDGVGSCVRGEMRVGWVASANQWTLSGHCALCTNPKCWIVVGYVRRKSSGKGFQNGQQKRSLGKYCLCLSQKPCCLSIAWYLMLHLLSFLSLLQLSSHLQNDSI